MIKTHRFRKIFYVIWLDFISNLSEKREKADSGDFGLTPGQQNSKNDRKSMFFTTIHSFTPPDIKVVLLHTEAMR